MITGGGALLTGLDRRLQHETGMPIHIATNPLQSVAIGSGQALEEFDALAAAGSSAARSGEGTPHREVFERLGQRRTTLILRCWRR